MERSSAAGLLNYSVELTFSLTKLSHDDNDKWPDTGRFSSVIELNISKTLSKSLQDSFNFGFYETECVLNRSSENGRSYISASGTTLGLKCAKRLSEKIMGNFYRAF